MHKRLAAVALATIALGPSVPTAAADVRAGIRVVTPRGALLEAPFVGATRSYRATDGTTHALPMNTALGQLVSAAGFYGLPLGVHQFSLGPFVEAIGGVRPPGAGQWAFFVDNRPATVGAGAYTLRRGQEATWVLDPSYAVPGPYFLDLDIVRASRRAVTFRVTRAGGATPVPARGATLRIGGQAFRVPATGRLRVTMLRPGTWTAVATAARTIRSEILLGGS